MIKIVRSNDCGNSPKNKFVEELEIALAGRDVEFPLNSVTVDIHWNIVGQMLRETVELSDGLYQPCYTLPK